MRLSISAGLLGCGHSRLSAYNWFHGTQSYRAAHHETNYQKMGTNDARAHRSEESYPQHPPSSGWRAREFVHAVAVKLWRMPRERESPLGVST